MLSDASAMRSWLASVLLAMAGCGRETSILLFIDGDLRPGVYMDAVIVAVPAEPEPPLAEGRYELHSDDVLPQTVAIFARETSNATIDVRVGAMLQEVEVLAARRSMTFVAGEQIEERICLWRRCVGATDRECLEGRCAAGDGDGDTDGDSDLDGDGDSDADGDADADVDTDVDTDVDSDGDEVPCTAEDCDDGQFCNGLESCTPAGCSAGTPPLLDDGVDCTRDACDELIDGTEHTPLDTLCSDGSDCTTDRCDADLGCVRDIRDRDGDGHGEEACGGDDCDDDDGAIHPGSAEACNATDDDCDGELDEGTCSGCDRRVRGGVVYLFCTSFRSWSQARGYCMDRGYDLVVIQDATEDEWLVSQVVAVDPTNDWYIGLSDRVTEGTYLWVDGTAAWMGGAPVGYTNFNTGAPDGFVDQDCVELAPLFEFRWDEGTCSVPQPFVCEFEVP
jgi:hypothetical protein